ncbi:bifunctional DNA primase/polymerase [Leuconostoc citreum]|uniref:bifunctional DNA primase/polymerase n=1 Tax=Leuconostoc citreum TaxID=33964 RepID=UPI002810B6BB|nr:bifunctional DNA primase/polymerase [Leuconostoc citreum]WMS78955.1 bifunctional DNA primase/polymerase [Leuconostoc citreum]
MNEVTKKALEQKFGDQVQETNTDLIIASHELIMQGFAVYLLSQGTNVPYEGSRGHLDATKDVNVLTDMFLKYGANSNIAITLRDSKLVVLDIDRHTPDKNGLNTLKQLGITANFDNEVFETTPRDGIHLFYRVPDDLDVSSLKRNIGAGLEVVVDKITLAPSVKGGVAYKHYGRSLNEANMMPQWLIDLASNVPTSGHTASKRVPKYSIDQRIQMIINGFTEGERNNQIMSFSGWLLGIRNINPNLVYELVQKINSYSAIPLPDKEVNAIFRSAYNREVKRASMGGR